MARAVLSEAHFHSEEAAFAYVEARLWPKGPVCHHCGERERVGKLAGKSTRHGLYKCYQCRKPFTIRMGTLFESSHLPLRLWLQIIHLMCASKKGISTRQIQRMLRCSMKTAWFLGHRIRAAMDEKPGVFYSPLGGGGKMNELRSEVEARLLQTADYRTLLALDRAIAEISGEAPLTAANGSSTPIQVKPKPNDAVVINGLSQADAAYVLLTQVLHEPAMVSRLVGALGAHGITVGGANPNINLSSVLSKDSTRFRSVRYKDRACWWVKGTPFPGELDHH